MTKTNIYVVTHKEFNYKILKNYIPIQVGKINTKINLPYIGDDTGANIAEKNNNYCELTAIYWIWKNDKSNNNIGICHYRRYFVHGLFCNLIDEAYINKIMKNYDVILPKPYQMKKSVARHFVEDPALNKGVSGFQHDLDNLRSIIEKKCPDYLNMYDKVMNRNYASYCNMCVMSKENFDNYCQWLFDILFELEKITNLNGYTKQQERIYGFLSEFLLNVWIEKNKLKIKYENIYYIENNKFKNALKKVKLGLGL